MIEIENVQKMLILFEQNQTITTIKGERYDILLETIDFPDNLGRLRNVMLSLRSKTNFDLSYTLQKISEMKYSKFQVGFFKGNIQISYILDIKSISVNILFDNIYLMEQLL
jgi:hypothetical protein